MTQTKILPTPLDGGWGWVVLAASFVCAAVIEGSITLLGIILPDLLVQFGRSRAETTLAGSLMVGIFLLSGPLDGFALTKFGCRWTTIAGGILTSLSFILSTFAPNLELFILFYGVLGGFGLGLIYLPATVMVGFYFEKKRALATGIATSGAGAGLVIFSATAAAVLPYSGWKTTVIVISMITLQSVVMGALMRPLEQNYKSHFVLVSESTDDEPAQVEELTESQRIRTSAQSNDDLRKVALHHAAQHAQMSESPSQQSQLDLEVAASNGTQSPTFCHNRRTVYSQSCGNLGPSTKSPALSLRSAGLKPRAQTFTTTSVSYQHLFPIEPIHPLPSVPGHLQSNPMMREDIFYSGSIVDLPEFKSQPDRDHYIMSYSNLSVGEMEEATSHSKCHNCLSAACTFLDISLLKSLPFVGILVANFLVQFAMFIPIVFIVDFAQSVQVEAQLATSLMSAVGVSNAFGRAWSGFCGNIQWVNCLYFTAVSLLIVGVSTFLAPVICYNYISLIVYAVIYGVFIGVFVPLTTVLLVQYVGLHRLTNAYGLLSMVKGIASLLGPPIAGAILDKSSSFLTAFSLAGSVFVGSGLTFLTVPLLHKLQMRRDEKDLNCPHV